MLPALFLLLGLLISLRNDVNLFFNISLLVVVALCFWRWRKTWLLFLLLGLVYGLISFTYLVWQVQVSPDWLDKKINISAQIQSVQSTAQYTKLRLSQVQQQSTGERLHGLADVYVYRSHQHFMPGQHIAATAKFHVPHNKGNPSSFDAEFYALLKGVALVGSASNVNITTPSHSWLAQQRSQILATLDVLPAEVKGILAALLLADRTDIPLPIDDAFAASGATHLLAISGLHMGLVAGWGFFLSWWLLTRREDWIVRLPVRGLSLVVGLLLACAYATLAGWPIPAQRAFLMLLAAVLAWWLRRKQLPLNTMLAALMLIVLIDPKSVLSVSLWLSFVATSALLIWASAPATVAKSRLQQLHLWCKGLLLVSVIAALATLPVITYVFGRLPVWSLLANVVLVPIYALWVLPLALLGEWLVLLGLIDWARVLFEVSGLGLHMSNQWLLTLYDWPWGKVWVRSSLGLSAALAMGLMVTGWLWVRQRHVAALVTLLIGLLMFVGFSSQQRQSSAASFFAWDVGQGASSLLLLPNFSLVVDVPGKFGSKFNGGSDAAANMRALGNLHLDALMLTHAQSDHAGGAERLYASLNGIDELWLADVAVNRKYATFQRLEGKVKEAGGRVRWLKQGDVWSLCDGSQFEVLWPPQNDENNNDNNMSLVLRVRLATGQHIFLGGDIEAKAERALLPILQKVDVMLMPHHGSKTSSTIAFVQKLQPDITIAQTGYRNHFGFPKVEVVQRYVAADSQILNTANGAVHIGFSDTSINVVQFNNAQNTKRKQLEDAIFHFITLVHFK